MKIRDRVYNIYLGIKKSIRRFPITIGFSVLMVILLIYFNENIQTLSLVIREQLNRIQLTVGMGILLSLCIDLLKERFFPKDRSKTLISHIGGIVFLILYYQFFLRNLEFVSIIRYVGIIIFLIMAFFYIPKLGRKDGNYEYYVIDIISNICVTAIYSIVLLIGIFAIYFTINSLFDMNIVDKIYFYTFLIIFFIFAISFFLSKVPKNTEEFRDYTYSKSLRVLLSYIVIPLISIYTIILYIYFAKILISWEWPKGLVSHLVLWYSSISVGIIFITNKIIEEDKVSAWFRKVFPKIVLPILVMMFISIGQRISQYGITENRYYVLVLGIWVTAMMLYFSFRKSIKTIVIPISLSLIVLNSVIGPLSGFSISKWSQNRRLNDILESNNMLEDKKIVINPNVSKDVQYEINNIVHYFNTKHDIKDISILDDDFTTRDMEDTFGFEYKPYILGGLEDRTHFFFHTDLNNHYLDIANYDYLIKMASWGEREYNIDNINIRLDHENSLLNILENNEELVKIDLKEEITKIYTENNFMVEDHRTERSPEEMTIEIENESLRIKLIFSNFQINLYGEEMTEAHSSEFILLLDIK